MIGKVTITAGFVEITGGVATNCYFDGGIYVPRR